MTIWKTKLDLTPLLAQWYALNRVDAFEVTAQLPHGARVLSALRDIVDVAIYAAVDPTHETIPYRFVIAGTGRGNVAEADVATARFVDSVALLDSTLIVHVFVVDGAS